VERCGLEFVLLGSFYGNQNRRINSTPTISIARRSKQAVSSDVLDIKQPEQQNKFHPTPVQYQRESEVMGVSSDALDI